jgi:hypothetical protein
MLEEGTLPTVAAEQDAIEKLRSENPNAAISFTRRDAGDSGPLLVHVGDDTYEVADDGKRKKVT